MSSTVSVLSSTAKNNHVTGSPKKNTKGSTSSEIVGVSYPHNFLLYAPLDQSADLSVQTVTQGLNPTDSAINVNTNNKQYGVEVSYMDVSSKDEMTWAQSQSAKAKQHLQGHQFSNSGASSSQISSWLKDNNVTNKALTEWASTASEDETTGINGNLCEKVDSSTKTSDITSAPAACLNKSLTCAPLGDMSFSQWCSTIKSDPSFEAGFKNTGCSQRLQEYINLCDSNKTT